MSYLGGYNRVGVVAPCRTTERRKLDFCSGMLRRLNLRSWFCWTQLTCRFILRSLTVPSFQLQTLNIPKHFDRAYLYGRKQVLKKQNKP